MLYLGIAQTNHGASAALYDGSTLLAANEERFDRIKFSSGYPRRAINWCLKEARATMHDVTAVGFYMTAGNYLDSSRNAQNDIWRNYPEALYTVPSEIYKKLGGREYSEIKHIHQKLDFFDGESKDIFFIDHHLAHAASSYLLSGFNNASVLCLDGSGDGQTVSWVDAQDASLKTVFKQPFPHSIGQLYASLTQFLGFSANSDEYKVMGIAAYGEPSRYYEKIKKLIKLHGDGSFELDMSYFTFHMQTEKYRYSRKLPELLGLEPNCETDTIAKDYRDLAASVQLVLEEVFQHVLNGMGKRISHENLCYGGGVALNCLANGRILPKTTYKEVFIPPNPGDPGLAIGCAAYLAHVIGGLPRTYVYRSDYLGPQYDSDTIRSMLLDNGLPFTEPEDLAVAVAERLNNSEVIGLFQGRQEFGPRALGNRSILADPRPQKMKEIVNRKIKFREPFRPFAPAVSVDQARSIYALDERALNPTAPEAFMLSTACIRSEWASILQATTHQDGTSRVQIVSEQSNPTFYQIIESFKKLTGVGVVMNTSFNVKDEPIVLTPEHAVRCFYSTGMDALAVGPYLIEKQKYS